MYQLSYPIAWFLLTKSYWPLVVIIGAMKIYWIPVHLVRTLRYFSPIYQFHILMNNSYVSDWTHMSSEIGLALLKWIYTDQVDFSRGENFTLDLMKMANIYQLDDLISK